MVDTDYRPLDLWLLLGMQTVPILFVWLFLRRSYRPSLRRAAFVYTAVTALLPLLGSFEI
ncbi:hypothetical protein [Sphingopyxis sp.]|uniref:hypothetical protein n=1 Tax=Sphingopyxis sp. TaxID=1908224 RepID=UPI003D0D7945